MSSNNLLTFVLRNNFSTRTCHQFITSFSRLKTDNTKLSYFSHEPGGPGDEDRLVVKELDNGGVVVVTLHCRLQVSHFTTEL